MTKDLDPRHKELIDAAFKFRGTEFARCFAPGVLCENKAVRAHSVQNATALDLLAVDGHVIVPAHRMTLERFDVALEPVGRNKATTFKGLCAEHDEAIFAPIDKVPVDFSSEQHLFLLAYRAVLFELHASCAAGWLLQMGYQKRVELGFDASDRPTPAGLFATDRLIGAYETFQYKVEFDKILAKPGYALLESDVIELVVERPTVAASAVFSLDGQANVEGDIVRVSLSILPVDHDRTLVVFSYLPKDAPAARSGLDRILGAAGAYQKYELSRYLLNHCANFVLAPDFVDQWSHHKSNAIADYFRRTILQNDLDFEHADLMLF